MTAAVARLSWLPVGRTLFVGDVHGCSDELEMLLDRVALARDDRVFFVGDLVARGPNSRGVLALIRKLGAQSVRGNHEWRLLEAHAARKRGTKGPLLGPAHQELLNELDQKDWELLESLPYFLELKEHDAIVVHAGLVPNVPLARQDPWLMTHMRSLSSDGTPSPKFATTPWARTYVGPHVIFGHNAQQGLQLWPHATGLDTGCVYGGALTGLLVQQGAGLPPVLQRRELLVSVPARRRYVDFESKR